MYEFKVSRHDDGRRLDKVLRGLWPAVPLSAIMRSIRKGNVRVCGRKAHPSSRLREGERVSVPWEAPSTRGTRPMPGPVDVVYIDEHMLVANKPAGLLSQPSSRTSDSLLGRIVAMYGREGGFPPTLVHRLDRNTSGLVMAALDGLSLRSLSVAMREGKIFKRYWVVVIGDLPDRGEIDLPLEKDTESNITFVSQRGSRALTRYRAILRWKDFTLAEMELVTGRPHQIRAHLAAIGYPIVGDVKYGGLVARRWENALRPLLHARELSFGDMPDALSVLSNMRLIAPLPPDFERLLPPQTALLG
ncbi:RluA family pseudouridine synthase [Acetomicrobium sp. S15 = DSM 107314]|uniref:RluA family pseudouridine synthase n=1 Tax=Acetomicrobium sp. S15 = DSM 107314 TaxID=2529858 RepID=UPI0022B7C6A4|nr:RluA family pseudouridine synthase [Acetomicrobium sp. S15 = DSM 107314]